MSRAQAGRVQRSGVATRRMADADGLLEERGPYPSLRFFL